MIFIQHMVCEDFKQAFINIYAIFSNLFAFIPFSKTYRFLVHQLQFWRTPNQHLFCPKHTLPHFLSTISGLLVAFSNPTVENAIMLKAVNMTCRAVACKVIPPLCKIFGLVWIHAIRCLASGNQAFEEL